MAEAQKQLALKLTLDASDYIASMKRATRATRRLAKAYRSLPRQARVIARLAQTHSISDTRLTDPNPTRRTAGPKVF